MNLLIFNIGDSIKEGFAGIILTLDGIIYGLISSMYKVYTLLASARILSSDAFTMIANKLYVIIGVAMLFVLAYSILRAIIDPDQAGKGDMAGGKIVKGVITCVLGLALTPVIFNVLYQGQDIILKQNIIGKMFFASDSKVTSHEDIKLDDEVLLESGEVKDDDSLYDSAGNMVAVYIWQAFFYPSELVDVSDDDITAKSADYFINPSLTAAASVGCAVGLGGAAIAAAVTAAAFLPWTLAFSGPAVAATVIACAGAVVGGISNAVDLANTEKITLAEAVNYAVSTGDFGIFVIFANNYIEGEITYNWGFSTIVGLFVAYAFLSFSIDMAVRAAKLAYYQVIAPIPLILQILPKFKSNFDKWLKNIISTFLEVFVRLSVVYIVVYIIAHLNTLTSSGAALWNNQNISLGLGFMGRLILILGLVIFARQAPKIITDTFGIPAGDMKLGLGKKLADGGAFTAAATVGAAVGGLAQNVGASVVKTRQNLANAHTASSKLRVLGGGIVSAAGSGVAGGLSAGTRTGYRGIRDMAHGKPMNMRDVRDATANGVRESNDRRVARENYRTSHQSDQALGGVVHGALAGHINDLTSSARSFLSGGTVDTSYYDNQVAALNKFKSLKGQLEDNVKDQSITDAQNEVDRLKGQSVKDYVYSEQQKIEKNKAREAILKRADGMSDADYDAAFASKIASLKSQYTISPTTMNSADKTAYEDFVNRFGSDVSTAGLERAFKADFESRYGKLSDFVLDPTSDAYTKATASFNAQLKSATDKVKEAKMKAVQSKLIEAISTGVDNDTSRSLKDFMRDNQSLFRNANGTMINGERLEVYLEKQFGSNILNGQIDMSKMFNGKTYELKLDNDNVVKVDFSHGDPIYNINDGDPAHQNMSKEAFSQHLSGNKIKISSTDVGSDFDPFKDMKTDSEKARDDIINSYEYQDAQSRKRQQSEKK